MSQKLDPRLFRADDDGTEEEIAPLVSEVSEEQSKQTVNKLVLSYLAHHGYVKTARAFQKQTRDAVEERTSVDDDIEMDDVPGPSTSSSSSFPTSKLEADIELRTRIVNSVLCGDIDSALSETRKHYSGTLEAEEGLMLVKLRCRKFVELVLETAELEKKMKAAKAKEEASAPEMDGIEEDGMGMDVDDEMISASPIANGSNGVSLLSSDVPSRPPSARALCTSQYEAALNAALTYGKTLDQDFKATKSPEAKNIFIQTFAILTSSDPLSAGGAIAEVAGHDARVKLANELNQAILSLSLLNGS